MIKYLMLFFIVLMSLVNSAQVMAEDYDDYGNAKETISYVIDELQNETANSDIMVDIKENPSLREVKVTFNLDSASTSHITWFESLLKRFFATSFPMEPVLAGGPGYVLEKIGREIGRVFKQLLRFTGQRNIRVGVNFDFQNGRPVLKDIDMGGQNQYGQEIKYRVYENKQDDGSTRWASDTSNLISAASHSARNAEYNDINTKEVLLKAFNIIEEPKYQPQDGPWLYETQRDIQEWFHKIFNANYEAPYEDYDYGYKQKLDDAYAFGKDLKQGFSSYDNYIKRYLSRYTPLTDNTYQYLNDEQKTKIQAYEREEWDRLLYGTSKQLFQHGMWNDDKLKNAFKSGFLGMDASYLNINDNYDFPGWQFDKNRLLSIEYNIQSDFESVLQNGYDTLTNDVEGYINSYLNGASIDRVLSEIARGEFRQNFKEAASEIIQAIADGHNGDDFSPPLDFSLIKKKIIAGSVLGGAITYGACEGICTMTFAGAGGLIGAVPGVAAGAEVGAVSCTPICYSLSAAGAACGGLLYTVDSDFSKFDKAYASRAKSGKNLPDSGECNSISNEARKANLPKAESKVWQEFKNYKKDIKTNGLKGKEKEFYKWDRLHNDIEVYDRFGKHLGSKDPITGEMYKGPVLGREL